jgi:hypothetical protein
MAFLDLLYTNAHELTPAEVKQIRALAIRAAETTKVDRKKVAEPREPVNTSVVDWFRNFPNLWVAVAKRLDINPDQEMAVLGKGEQGTAYQLPGNRVLKLTNDSTEVFAMTALKAKPNKNFVQVYDTFRAIPAGREDAIAFGVVMEKLAPPAPWQEAWVDAMFAWREASLGMFEPIDEYQVEDFEDFVSGKEPLENKAADQKTRAYLKDITPEQFKYMSDWFKEVCRHLVAMGVKFRDLHGGNVMSQGGRPIVIDLGVSELTQIPPVPDKVSGKVNASSTQAEFYDPQYPSIASLLKGLKKGELLVHMRKAGERKIGKTIYPSAGALLTSTEAWQVAQDEYGTGPELTFFSEGLLWAGAGRDEAIFVRKEDEDAQIVKHIEDNDVQLPNGAVVPWYRTTMYNYDDPNFREVPSGVEPGDWFTSHAVDVVASVPVKDLIKAKE